MWALSESNERDGMKKHCFGKKYGVAPVIFASTVVFVSSFPVMADQAMDPSLAYAPGRERVIPHVSGDEKNSNTYENWKTRDAVKSSIARGLSDVKMNYKNIRWLKQDYLNGSILVEEAGKLYGRKNSEGKSCASCHGDSGEKFKGVAARYPIFDNKLKKVMALTSRINNCSTKYLKNPMPEDAVDNNLLAVFVTSFSNGTQIALDVKSEGPLKDSYARGKDLFFKRVGQYNFACASCHTGTSVLKKLRGMHPSTPYGDAAQYPIYEFPNYPDRQNIVTLQHQIEACSAAARMQTAKEGGPEYTDMEVFLRSLSNGYPINVLSSYYGEALD
jgi:sulfur-oxidizing protein SoxA